MKKEIVLTTQTTHSNILKYICRKCSSMSNTASDSMVQTLVEKTFVSAYLSYNVLKEVKNQMKYLQNSSTQLHIDRLLNLLGLFSEIENVYLR